MRSTTRSVWVLGALGAISLGCSADRPAPTGPGADQPAGAAEGPSFAVYGLNQGVAGSNCRTAPHRQFDFWIGSWQVAANGGPPRSASFITSALDGCVIREQWHSPSSTARSLSAFDASDGQWHQHYVENSGFFPLRLDGGVRGGAMVMQGSYPDPYGTPRVFTDRYTWTALGPDDVRQAQDRSLDGGATFGPIAFDGRYHRTASPVVPAAPYYGYCASNDPSLLLFHEFDFLAGAWDVRVDGSGAAHAAEHRTPLRSDITHEVDGCLLEETLTGAAGYRALVFLNIRPLDEIWQRTYIDNRGLRIFLTGPRMQNGRTVLTGTMPSPGRGSRPVRVTIEQTDADHFVERWEQSESDDTWSPLLTASYQRR